MKTCDTCKHFVLVPGLRDDERWGWCNAPLPDWLDSVASAMGREASAVLISTDRKHCESYVKATT